MEYTLAKQEMCAVI